MSDAGAALLTRAPHFAWFCKEFLQHSIDVFDGLPVELEPWQLSIFEEALTLEEDGAFLWRSIAIVLPRKNGKTTLLAAYALYRLLYDGGMPEILLAAASDKQAGRLFEGVTSFIRRSPRLQEVLVVRDYIGEIARRDGEGKILRMSSSPERLHGYNPSLVICDEVAQWVTPSLRKAWAALTTGGGARAGAQTFTISTAGEGHQRAESILGRMIDGNEADGDVERRGALTISRNHAAQTLVFNYAAKTTSKDDLAAIKEANPASWITEKFLARQAANPELTEAEFLQLHACVWAEGESQWLSADHWKARHQPRARLKPGDLIALGFDGARVYDSTALVACRLTDLTIFPLHVWERPGGVSEWEVPVQQVNDLLASAMSTYRVARGYFDPPYWQTDIDRWFLEYGEPAVMKFPTFSTPRITAAAERFRVDTLTNVLSHAGEPVWSKTLARHVANARRTPVGVNGYKLEKPGKRAEDKIDAALAAILAYEAAADAIADGALSRRKSRRLIPLSD